MVTLQFKKLRMFYLLLRTLLYTFGGVLILGGLLSLLGHAARTRQESAEKFFTKLYAGQASREEIDNWRNTSFGGSPFLFYPFFGFYFIFELLRLAVWSVRHSEEMKTEIRILLIGLIMVFSAMLI